MGLFDYNPLPEGGYANALHKAALENRKKQLENQYYGPNIQSEIENRNALTNKTNVMTPLEANELNLKNQYYAPNIQSEIANRNALTSKYNTMTPLEAQELRVKNQFAPQREQADINYRNMGMGRGGVGATQDFQYQLKVNADNPQITDPIKQREAANVIENGGNRLSDGTIVNPPSSDTLRALDRAKKSTTTAALLTQQVRANQAEAEIPVVDKYISQGRSPYGDTVMGQSINLQKDSFDTKNEAAQTRLGKYYASELLNFDKAALQTRIAGTESGVTIINEIMNKAKQSIKSNTLLKTDKSRQVALDTVSKALREMLAARNKFGTGLSSVGRMQQQAEESPSGQNEGIVEFVRDANGNLVMK